MSLHRYYIYQFAPANIGREPGSAPQSGTLGRSLDPAHSFLTPQRFLAAAHCDLVSIYSFTPLALAGTECIDLIAMRYTTCNAGRRSGHTGYSMP